MRVFEKILELPPSLLTVILLLPTAVQPLSRPEYLQSHDGHSPQHGELLKRNYEAQQKLALQAPAGVRKMSEDEGEKFFLDYWVFHEPDTKSQPRTDDGVFFHNQRDAVDSGKASAWNKSSLDSPSLLPPTLLHENRSADIGLTGWLFGRNVFERDFKCPSGTTSCAASIDQPNFCCQNSDTCISVGSTAGCCPAGQTCGGSISSCDTAQGYTSCPNNPNGGCCIPNYACQGVGCVLTDYSTTATTLPLVTVTSGASSSQSETTTTTTTGTITSPSLVTITTTATDNLLSTLIVTILPPGTTTVGVTVTSASTITTTTSDAPSDPPSTIPASAPILPTSVSTTQQPNAIAGTISVTTYTTTVPVSACPTGFYMCSAYYLGGCCRVDRNCDTYSCPTSDSTSVVTSNGLTVIVPVGASSSANADVSEVVETITSTTTLAGAAAAAKNDNCANGWFLCDTTLGGGCCPSGYVCGASCTASSGSNVAKETPSSHAVRAAMLGWGFLVLGVVTGAGMILL